MKVIELAGVISAPVYRDFTDSTKKARLIFERLVQEKQKWSGHVVCTLSAGWPIPLTLWGAACTTVIERNIRQIDWFCSEFGDVNKVGDLYKHVFDSMILLQGDINQISVDSLNLMGDEVVYLSNIYDHCISQGTGEEFADQIVSLGNSVSVGSTIDIILTTNSPYNLYQLAKYLRNAECLQVSFQMRTNEDFGVSYTPQGKLNYFAVYTFFPRELLEH